MEQVLRTKTDQAVGKAGEVLNGIEGYFQMWKDSIEATRVLRDEARESAATIADKDQQIEALSRYAKRLAEQLERVSAATMEAVDIAKSQMAELTDLREKAKAATDVQDLSTTIAYEGLLEDGRRMFFDRLTGAAGADVSDRMQNDVITLFNAGLKRSKPTSANIHLCRLLGYLDGLVQVAGGVPAVGFRFESHVGEDGKARCDGHLEKSVAPAHAKPVASKGQHSMQAPTVPAPEKPAGATESSTADDFAHLDALDGPALEAALAKMTEVDRARYLKAS